MVVVLAAVLAGGGDWTTVTVPGCRAVLSTGAGAGVVASTKADPWAEGEALTADIGDQLRQHSRSNSTSRHSPKFVNSVAYLARKGFYDGLDFAEKSSPACNLRR